MRVHILMVLAVGLMVMAATGQENRPLPPKQQPWYGIARMDKNGIVVVRQKVTEFREEERTGKGGQSVIVQVPMEWEKMSRLNSKDIEVFTREGQKVDANALPALLKQETQALVFPAGEKPNASVFKTLKEGVLVMVLLRPSEPDAQQPKDATKVLFFTPHDQALAKALLDGKDVGTIVIHPYKAQPRECKVSQIKIIKGEGPEPGTYYLESLPSTANTRQLSEGYFPQSLYTGARIRAIKYKGVFTAEVQRVRPKNQPVTTGTFMTCEALVFPLSDN